jgi:hypothetical protein
VTSPWGDSYRGGQNPDNIGCLLFVENNPAGLREDQPPLKVRDPIDLGADSLLDRTSATGVLEGVHLVPCEWSLIAGEGVVTIGRARHARRCARIHGWSNITQSRAY